MRQRISIIGLGTLGMLMWAAACAPSVALPTPVPTAMIPATATMSATVPATATMLAVDAPEPTSEDLPPTSDLATSPAAATPTAVFSTRLPTTTPTPVIGPVINIGEPFERQPVIMGSELAVSGFAQVAEGMEIQVGLTSAAGQTLSTAEASVEVSQWTATLTVPELVTGLADVHAVIVDAGGEEVARSSVPVTLTADRQVNESYVTLIRPEPGSIGVAGHNFYLDGQLWRQGGGDLQVAVLMDGCREVVGDFFFQLGISSYWQGYVTLPPDVSGPACAMAWVGTPGDAGWRAAQVPVTILHQDDPLATGIMISNPRAGRNLTAGETILVTGVAYNVPGRTVNIEVLLPSNGQVLGEASDDADFYGYWSAEVTLPASAEGEAVVRVTTGERAQPDSESEVLFNIVPP